MIFSALLFLRKDGVCPVSIRAINYIQGPTKIQSLQYCNINIAGGFLNIIASTHPRDPSQKGNILIDESVIRSNYF